MMRARVPLYFQLLCTGCAIVVDATPAGKLSVIAGGVVVMVHGKRHLSLVLDN